MTRWVRCSLSVADSFVRIRFDMHVAGVILALLFGLAHANNFWAQPFWFALAQQFYAFALGMYAY